MRVAITASALLVAIGLISQQASAQTLQLPTFSFTTVTTTVMVPDQGAAFLGGINRAAEGRSEFGIPGLPFPGLQSRGIGQNMSSSGMWVTAQVHDFDAMDQALLNTPTDLAGTYPTGLQSISDLPAPRVAPSLRPDAVNLAGNWRPEPKVATPVSNVAVEEADREVRRATRSTEAEDYFARGQQAEADGKPAVARVYYQMASRRATGELKQLVQARLDVVSGRNAALAESAK